MKLAITLLVTLPLLVSSQKCGGAHIKSGQATCTCNPDGSISCSSFQICGVGNNNAQAQITADFTATVTCRNKGGNIVEVKTQNVPAENSSPILRPDRNGCLTVPSLSVTAPQDQDFFDAAVCPNGNWEKSLRGNPTTTGFSYDVFFPSSGCEFVSIDTCA
ncbi:hypothetical protein ASPWEDRAFT_39661 [Aspergillus wentii DTO 134E9]|uniref:Cyanovirin-N domain-containing protein n=1 Tax=Aspergillus wentii DTO 134E9 TaxID=1073089 RepID=A0A1L9RSU1_ASPWE|nr:uncharacterized protein ASPWEDRAFT_39661 [Aspergillus wentii DTO 134E9]OJJ37953.1 hypothetical protein ASPWEDRAFT_39661 [Aspergillus wentii DTO 134E9]